MKTILFVDKADSALWNSYLSYDFIMGECEEAGLYEICPWRPEGRSVSTAIPGLGAMVADEESWRAVIVRDLRTEHPPVWEDPHFDNPYDFSENYDFAPGQAHPESPRAFLRLVQMLGGLPEAPQVLWPEIGDKKERLDDYDVGFSRSDEHYEMLDRYRLGVSRPESIICVTPRDVDGEMFEARYHDLAGQDDGNLDFWQRNGYPANARLLVCDVDTKARAAQEEELIRLQDEGFLSFQEAFGDNKGRRDPWFSFWVGVLALMHAELDPGYFRPFRVHSLQVEVDESQLVGAFADRYTQWAAVRELIGMEQQIEDRKLEASATRASVLPNCDTNISVSFDMADEDDLKATCKVGLIRDEPVNDMEAWNRERRKVKDALASFMRAPRRGIINAAAVFRKDSSLPKEDLEYCLLGEYQRDELSDRINELEFDLARETSDKAFCFDACKTNLDDRAEKVKEAVEARPKKPQVMFAIAVAEGSLVVGMLPFILGLSQGFSPSLPALVITVLACLVLGGVLALSLMNARDRVKVAYRSFNEGTNGILGRLHTEAKRLGHRLSSYATFRKLWQVHERQERQKEPSERSVKLGYYDALLGTRMGDVQSIVPLEGADETLLWRLVDEGWEKAEELLKDESFFNAKLYSESRCPLNAGDPDEGQVEVPYEFVTAMALKPVKTR